jgi:hypothetical protein
MPNLSWVKITPNIVSLSGKQSKLVEVTIYIPDAEKPLHYNERWEFVVVLSEIKDEPVNIATELAIPVRIKTPESAKAKMQIPNLFMLFIIVVGCMFLTIFVLYVKNKKRTLTGGKSVFFYFKKRKLKNK